MGMAITGWLKNTFRRGDPLRHVSNHVQANRIANVLLDLQGIGCRVEKPTHAEGRGWRIIVDGSTDQPFPDGVPSYLPPNGNSTGDMLYWDDDDSEWKILPKPDDHAVLCFDPDIEDPDYGGLVWRTAAYDYQVLQRKEDDTIDFDWVRAHA